MGEWMILPVRFMGIIKRTIASPLNVNECMSSWNIRLLLDIIRLDCINHQRN